MDLRDGCQGCRSLIDDHKIGTFCSITPLSMILSFAKVCPCRTCLLKCMCSSKIKKHVNQGFPYCELFLKASKSLKGNIAYG
jgi:hypothetical protein